MNIERLSQIICGALLVLGGLRITRTGKATYGLSGDHFDFFPWTGWFFSAVGILILYHGVKAIWQTKFHKNDGNDDKLT